MARALEKVRRAAELKKGIWFRKGNKKGSMLKETIATTKSRHHRS